MARLFGTDGVRGIANVELTCEMAYRLGQAAAIYLGKTIVVGRDTRRSGDMLGAALSAGIMSAGGTVLEAGIIPTPGVALLVREMRAAGGAVISASHNPPEYNGVKFMLGQEPITRRQIQHLAEIIERRAFSSGEGSVTKIDLKPAYEASLLKRFGARRPLSVVIDAGNGAMSRLAPAAFRGAGYRVTELFCEFDGAFPNRSPNPAEYDQLGALCEKVVETGASFGAAFDGDGDRVVFVDEKGRPVQNEKSLALFIRHLLKDRPTPVVYDQKSSSAVRRAILAMDGAPVPERSGHAFIKRRFLEVGAAVAGEVSGHFFFGELGYDDGLYAALMMGEILGLSEKPLSALADEIVCPPITPDIRLRCPYAEQQSWLDRVEALAETHPCKVSHMDGVRLDFDDGWVLMRKSVTAEQITLRAEADTPERLNELMAMVAQALPEGALA